MDASFVGAGKFTIPKSAKPGMIYNGCHCGTGHMTVLPTGDVYACRRMESKVGNVAENSLEELFFFAADGSKARL